MPKMLKTGFSSKIVSERGYFLVPDEVTKWLGLSANDCFLCKVIQNGSSEYPFIVKYEYIDEGSVTDDVNSFEKCTLCGYPTTTVAHRLNGKAICADCAEKLGGVL